MRPYLFCVLAPAAFAGCVSFPPPPAGSGCAASSPLVKWVNPPAAMQTEAGRTRYYDKTIHDPAFLAAVKTSGDAVLDFSATGPHPVEVFVMAADGGKDSFLLEAGGEVVDRRWEVKPGPMRLRPRSGARRFTLLAIVDGPKQLKVRTQCAAWGLSAIRWSTRAEFEKKLAPVWLERARWLHTHALFEGQEGGPMARRHYLEQLHDRLYLSADPAVKKEALLGLTRAWYWLAAENHEPFDLNRTEALFRECLKAAPEDPLVRQMISSSCAGTPSGAGRMPQGDFCGQVKAVPWKADVPAAPRGAPDWAVAQRKLKRRMDAITAWWVEKRQQPNGELGGAWNDDVEILRHWGPQAMGLGSEVAAKGLRNIADGLWKSDAILNGYSRPVRDVEHSSEETTDTQPLLAALLPDTPEVRDRLNTTAACSEYWIGPQRDGMWRFHSSWFNCREVDTSPAHALDVHLNTRAMGPALWSAYLSRDPKLIERITRWAESWRKAMRSTDHGKSAGVIPSVLRASDGAYLIGSDRWDKPDAEWDYFQWSGGSQESIVSLFLAVNDLTGDEQWLEAATESFNVLNYCDRWPEQCKAIKGAPEAFFEWRKRTGNTWYDSFFGYQPPGADDAMLANMVKLAGECEEGLAYNFDIFTSEVLYTDRVYYRMPSEYRQRLFGGEAPRGDRCPFFSVTWAPSADEYGRAVLAADARSLRIRAYNFEAKPVEATFRAWRLQPGEYRLAVDGAPATSMKVDRLPHLVRVTLPPAKEVTILVEKPRA